MARTTKRNPEANQNNEIFEFEKLMEQLNKLKGVKDLNNGTYQIEIEGGECVELKKVEGLTEHTTRKFKDEKAKSQQTANINESELDVQKG